MIRLRKNVLFVVLMTIIALFLFNCEGPAGDDGTDGTDGTNGANGANGVDGITGSDGLAGGDGVDGVDGNVTCFQCHATEIFEQARYDFVASQHSSGSVAVAYAGGNVAYGACTECHSHEGFVAFANGFDAQHITKPSPWECGTCHTLHTEFTSEDYNLRMTTAASIWDGGTFVLKGQSLMELEGGDALCANCHQSRTAGPTDMGGTMVDLDGDRVPETLVPAGSFFISSSHYGPHHGPQANTLTGAGFPELVGSTAYPALGSNVHLAASCTGCHMNENDHSFEPSLVACNVCHATNDFDYGGVQEEVEELLDDLAVILEANGVIVKGHDEEYAINQETGTIELVVTVGGYHPVVGIHSLLNSQAFFIWIGLEEDRSFGVHNPKYVIALLENIIEALS